MAPGRGQNLVEGGHGFGRQFRQLAAASDEHVRGQHGRAAGVGDDGQMRAAGARLLGKNFGHVEQFGDVFHAQHAGALEGRLQNFIAPGQRAGVGGGGLGGGGGAAGLDDDDRLGQRHFAGGGQERAGVADGFHVDDNAAGARIVAQMIDQVAPADIDHRTKRNKGAEADILLQAPIQDRGAERAALADESDAPGPGHVRGESGIEFPARHHHAQAIRPHDAHLAAPRLHQDLPFQLQPRRAGFLEAG